MVKNKVEDIGYLDEEESLKYIVDNMNDLIPNMVDEYWKLVDISLELCWLRCAFETEHPDVWNSLDEPTRNLIEDVTIIGDLGTKNWAQNLWNLRGKIKKGEISKVINIEDTV